MNALPKMLSCLPGPPLVEALGGGFAVEIGHPVEITFGLRMVEEGSDQGDMLF